MDHFDHLWKMEYSENTASDIITLANTITSWLLCFHSSSVQSIHIIRCFTLKTVAMGSYAEVYEEMVFFLCNLSKHFPDFTWVTIIFLSTGT